jgi:membrane protease YdiL (CAAX protease family)
MEQLAGTEALRAILPLLITMLAGMAPSRHDPPSPFFANQQWRYRDVVFVLAIITAIDLTPVPRLSVTAPIWASAIINGSIAFIILASVWSLVRLRHRRPWRALGFDPSMAIYNTLWSLRIVLGLVSVFTAFVLLLRLHLSDAYHVMAVPRGAVSQDQRSGFIAATVVTAILAPVAEELVFRGFAYGPLVRKFGAAGGAVASAFLWALAHDSQLSHISVVKFFWVLVLGVVFAEMYRRRESLVPTITFHIVSNATAVFLADWRHLPTLITFGAVSMSLWIISAILFHIVRGQGKSRLSGAVGATSATKSS